MSDEIININDQFPSKGCIHGGCGFLLGLFMAAGLFVSRHRVLDFENPNHYGIGFFIAVLVGALAWRGQDKFWNNFGSGYGRRW